jgi:molecular chaperone DnaK (HSP70)
MQHVPAGGTHVPAVRQLVEQATSIEAHSGLDPELCVALGAGMQVIVRCNIRVMLHHMGPLSHRRRSGVA